MSEVHTNIVVEDINSTIVVDSTNINIVPDAIQLQLYTSAAPIAGGNNGELLYNKFNTIAGVPNTAVAVSNGTVAFNSIANIRIAGGNSGYFLQTDGSGNLTWAEGTSNVTGNGTSAGSNNQIQLGDGIGGFKVGPGFLFDPASNVFLAPGNIEVADSIIAVGNVEANYFIGNGAFITGLDTTQISNGTSNVVTYSSGFVQISANGIANVLTVGEDSVVVAGNVFSNVCVANILNAELIQDLRTTDLSIHLGLDAGNSLQSTGAIAIGTDAGYTTQDSNAISIGYRAGYEQQSTNAIAIGTNAGNFNQGPNSIAIGTLAGSNNQHQNTIIINATGQPLNASATDPNAYSNAFYVKPIRSNSAVNLLYYDPTTGEVTYSGPNFANLSVTGTTTVQQIKEKVVANSTGSKGTIAFDLSSSAILFKTSNASANFTLNFTGLGGLDSVMNSNESMTCTFINTNGAIPYIPSQLQIDGANITPVWSGPTGGPGTGTTNGKDMYTFNIIKTAANTFSVFASRVGFV